ncbi:MAG: dynein regulation protein LC7 [Bacillati bacterium ANGP1]|uniref:Dynein regulation protein LC7 n=1 Tax=Candidatus Segetimicrobium genomatis TaxID=2569760 RepID=A0A537LUF7_9BACT|nr:MAG: dynein regulation protein LC7 [Terrabacteria group bacterium ANGP1]TMJ11648.1 MAG: dynein regulation protein LC7 [Terrabacteria group bacterium ANGP1]
MADNPSNAPTFQRFNEPEGGVDVQTADVAVGGLRGILEALLKVEGVTAAMVVGRDGFAIEAVSSGSVETDSVAAIAASSVTAAEAMGETLKLGAMGTILLEYELGPVAVTPAGPDAVLAVVGNQSANLGRVRIEMRKVRQAVASQL